MNKPRIFFASALESKKVVEAMETNLVDFAFCDTWYKDVFKPSELTIEALENACEKSDYGVFVCTPDDVSIIRGCQKQVARSNVIYELGLFSGRKGRRNAFIVVPDFGHAVDLPSDLNGLTYIKVDIRNKLNKVDELTEISHSDLVDFLKAACNKIQTQIIELEKKREKDLRDSLEKLIEALCYATSTPMRPADSAIRVFVFKREGNELAVKAHFDPQSIGESEKNLKLNILEKKDLTVVRALTSCETQSESTDPDEQARYSADLGVKKNLKHIVAAPILPPDMDKAWGVVNFDTSTIEGLKTLDSQEAKESIFRLAKFIASTVK